MDQVILYHINRSLSCYGVFCKLFTEDENHPDFEYFCEIIFDEDSNSKHDDNCKCELCFGKIMYINNNDGYAKFYSHYIIMMNMNYLLFMKLSNYEIVKTIINEHYSMNITQ